jgi:hypothetical protein
LGPRDRVVGTGDVAGLQDEVGDILGVQIGLAPADEVAQAAHDLAGA